MIYYVTLFLKYEFEDNTYLLSTTDYELKSEFGNKELNELISLSIVTIENMINKKVKNCYTVSKKEYENDSKEEEEEITVLYEDKK